MKTPVVQKITIKSMNQKIRRVGERFGIDSLPYKQLIADIERDFRGMTHKTAKGFIQVTQSKTAKINEYQKQVVNRVAGRKGVKEIVKAAKERLNNPKASKTDIDKEVKQYTEIQEKFDKTLDMIYDHEIKDDLPTDIKSRYMKIYRHGKGAGMGVSSDDVAFLEQAIFEFDDLRNELDEINSDVKEIIYSNGGNLQENFANDVYKIESGQMDFESVKQTIEKMRIYRDELSNSFDPLKISYE